ncbi:hypothetical protein PTKIN_Ptkin02bG0154400 [Pterospermum kingtungense]
MALSRFLSLITLALLFCSVIAQSPTPSPKKSPSSPPKVTAPSPSKTPTATEPSPVTVESPTSPVTSPTSISESPAEAPGPAENSAVLNFNRFGAAGSLVVGVFAAVMAL